MITSNKKDFDTLLNAFKQQKVIRLRNKHGVLFENIVPVTMTRDKLICVQPITRHILMFEQAEDVQIIGDLPKDSKQLTAVHEFKTPQSCFINTKEGEKFKGLIKTFSIQNMAITTKHHLVLDRDEVVSLAILDRNYKAKVRDIKGSSLSVHYDYFSGVRIARAYNVQVQETVNANLQQKDVQQAILKLKEQAKGGKLVDQYLLNIPQLIKNLDLVDEMYCKRVLDILQETVQSIIEFFFSLVEGSEKTHLESFMGLYQDGDEEVASAQQDINDDIDDLISQVQAQMEEGDDAEIEVVEDESKKQARLSLAGYQKHLEGKHVSQKNLEESLEEFVEHLQFHDLIRQMFENVHENFRLLSQLLMKNIEKVRAVDQFDFSPFLQDMNSRFISSKERKVFYHFLNQLLETKPSAKQVKKPPAKLMLTFNFFTKHYFAFVKNILSSTSVFTEKAVNILAARIKYLMAESDRLEVFSEDSIKSMAKVGEVMDKNISSNAKKSKLTKQMASDLRDVAQQNKDFHDKISPILEFFKFHENVQNKTGTWLKTLSLYRKALFFTRDDEIRSVFNESQKDFSSFLSKIQDLSADEYDHKMLASIFEGRIDSIRTS